MKSLIDRLKREPILSRAGLAAILNVLVLAGVIDTGVAEGIETAVLAVVNAILLASARGKVTADADLVDYAQARRESGLPARTK